MPAQGATALPPAHRGPAAARRSGRAGRERGTSSECASLAARTPFAAGAVVGCDAQSRGVSVCARPRPGSRPPMFRAEHGPRAAPPPVARALPSPPPPPPPTPRQSRLRAPVFGRDDECINPRAALRPPPRGRPRIGAAALSGIWRRRPVDRPPPRSGAPTPGAAVLSPEACARFMLLFWRVAPARGRRGGGAGQVRPFCVLYAMPLFCPFSPQPISPNRVHPRARHGGLHSWGCTPAVPSPITGLELTAC